VWNNLDGYTAAAGFVALGEFSFLIGALVMPMTHLCTVGLALPGGG
jgi:hypothetical protein